MTSTTRQQSGRIGFTLLEETDSIIQFSMTSSRVLQDTPEAKAVGGHREELSSEAELSYSCKWNEYGICAEHNMPSRRLQSLESGLLWLTGYSYMNRAIAL